MIKINKDLSVVPDSLQIPEDELFPNGIPQTSQTTHSRRLDLIAAKKYKDDQVYNSRYKLDDTQNALKEIYFNKCAYCEQKVEQSHIEHYRPKSKYYWLAFSWDNLLIACSTCNQFKGSNFDIKGKPVEFEHLPENIKSIHTSSGNYDAIEVPKMVNPEVTNPKGYLKFNTSGGIESDDPRFAYTIETCKLDRTYLKDERRKILDILERDLKSAIVEYSSIESQTDKIDFIIRKFLRDSNDNELQFLGFRRYSLTQKWINDIIKSLTNS